MDFVCQSQIRGMTRNRRSDGVLSLTMAPSSFISQLVRRKKLRERKFSLCFNQQGSYQADGASIGSIQLGEVNRQHHTSSLLWALNRGSASHGNANYAVQIKNLYLGIGGGNHPLLAAAQDTMSIIPLGQNVAAFTPPEQWLSEAIIQTNKAITQLPKNYEHAFETAFSQLMGVAYDINGIHLAQYDIASLPTLFIQLEPHLHEQVGIPSDLPGFAGRLDAENRFDILLAIPPQNYFMYDAATHIATPTIHFSEALSFLGANVFQGHEVVFDLDNSRIGFAEHARCEDSLSLLTPVNPHLEGRTIDGNGTEVSVSVNNSTTNSTGNATDGVLWVSAGPQEEPDDGSVFTSGQDGGILVSADPEEEPASSPVNATNETIVVGGGAPPVTEEQPTGIPPADGRGTFHVGPGAVRAAEVLENMNRHKGLAFDFFHLLGLLVLIASFAITVFATRDRSNGGRDTKFKSSDTPVFYSEPDLEARAWKQPPPPQYSEGWEKKPTPSLGPQQEMEDITQTESEEQGSLDQSQKEEPEVPKTQRRSVGLQLWSNSTRELYKKKQEENQASIANAAQLRQNMAQSWPSLPDDGSMSKGSVAKEELSRVSEEQSQFSSDQESDASYFVKKAPSKSDPLPPVPEASSEAMSSVTESEDTPSVLQELKALEAHLEEAAHGDINMSQRTPAGVRFLESVGGSDMDGSRRASATTQGSDPSTSVFNYSTSESSYPPRQPAAGHFADDFGGNPATSTIPEHHRDSESTESSAYTDPASSSIPGMGQTSSQSSSIPESSIPGMGMDQASSQSSSVPESSIPGMGPTSSLPGMGPGFHDSAAISKSSRATSMKSGTSSQSTRSPLPTPYEVDDEEEDEENDYFPGPDEKQFVPGVDDTGYLVAQRHADDDQSLLTMEEFPDVGSVSTRDTREDASQAATQVSEFTAQRSNQSKSGSRRWAS